MMEREKRMVKMDKNNPTEGSGQGNNFFGGFLLGLLVGGTIVFLLGTKKGKKLLKAISEDGIDNISNILDKTNSSLDSDEDVVKPKIVARKPEAQKKEFVQKREFAFEEKPKARRFFRGISRRVN